MLRRRWLSPSAIMQDCLHAGILVVPDWRHGVQRYCRNAGADR